MPTLTLEIAPLVLPVDELDGTFFVAQTKPRQDKQLSRELSAMGIANYIPLLRRTRIIHRQRIEQQIPVIPGYVFVCGDVDARYEATASNRVCTLIDVHDQPRLRRELSNLQKSLEHPAEIYADIVRGKRYRVTKGSLMGVEGTVIGSTSNGCRFVVEVHMFGRGVEIEVDGSVLEPC